MGWVKMRCISNFWLFHKKSCFRKSQNLMSASHLDSWDISLNQSISMSILKKSPLQINENNSEMENKETNELHGSIDTLLNIAPIEDTVHPLKTTTKFRSVLHQDISAECTCGNELFHCFLKLSFPSTDFSFRHTKTINLGTYFIKFFVSFCPKLNSKKMRFFGIFKHFGSPKTFSNLECRHLI